MLPFADSDRTTSNHQQKVHAKVTLQIIVKAADDFDEDEDDVDDLDEDVSDEEDGEEEADEDEELQEENIKVEVQDVPEKIFFPNSLQLNQTLANILVLKSQRKISKQSLIGWPLSEPIAGKGEMEKYCLMPCSRRIATFVN